MGPTTTELKRKKFQDLRSEGQSVRQVAEAVGIAASTGYQWSRATRQAQADGRPANRISHRGGSSKGAPLFARLYPQSQAPSPRIELEVAGVVIRVDNGFDAEVLGKVLAAVRGGT